MSIYPLLFALALGQAPGQDKPALSVQVGVFAYRADGSRWLPLRQEASQAVPGNVFSSSPCSVGRAAEPPPMPECVAGHGFKSSTFRPTARSFRSIGSDRSSPAKPR